eukprot:518314_1
MAELAEYKEDKYTEFAVSQMIKTEQQLQEYQKDYNTVYKAMMSIPPKSRQIKKTHEVVVTDYDDLDDVGEVLAESCADDIGQDLPSAVLAKLQTAIKFAKKRKKQYKTAYYDIKISGEWGGKSDLVFGLMGMKKLNEKECAIGVSLYQEIWIEQDNVKINLDAVCWNDDKVQKFLVYQLYKELQKQLTQ